MRRALLPISCLLAFSLAACAPSPRDQLERMGISFSVMSLLAAAEQADRHVVRLFLDAGMTPNGTDERRRSVLSAAARGGDPEIVAALVAAGADANLADEEARTPLMEAALGGHLEAARILLRAGANPRAVRADGMTVLMQAAAAGQGELVSALLARDLEIDEPDPFGNTALLHAVEGGHADVVDSLLRAGADPDARTRTLGSFALGIAAAKGDVASARRLLAAGAQLELRDFEHGASALFAAALKGQAATARLLLEAGADPEGSDDDGSTPLVAAANGGHAEVIAPLLAHGANADARGPRGATALMFAAAQGHRAAVQALLEAGADPALETEGRYSALRAAEREDHVEVAALLEVALERRRQGMPGARRWARFARYGDAYRTPSGWRTTDPLTTDAGYETDYSILGIDSNEGPRTRRALLSAGPGAGQILLVRGPRSEWMPRVLERSAPLDRELGLDFEDAELRSADGQPIGTLRIERGGDPASPARRHLLGVVDLGEEVLLVDAGGPAESFDFTVVERFLASLRVDSAAVGPPLAAFEPGTSRAAPAAGSAGSPPAAPAP